MTWAATRNDRTSLALTHPVTPFGLMGSCTLNQRGAQSAPTSVALTANTVRTPFAFRRPKRARGAPRGVVRAMTGLTPRTATGLSAAAGRTLPPAHAARREA